MYCATYNKPVAEMAPYYVKLMQKMDAPGDASIRRTCTGYSGSEEVSCIAAMEAQACGLPIIASNRWRVADHRRGSRLPQMDTEYVVGIRPIAERVSG